MKKIILIGATLLVTTTAIVMANTNCDPSTCPVCPDECCQVTGKCPNPAECSK